MKREFNYNDISILDIESNKHFDFVCDADRGTVVIERKKEND